MVKFFALFLVGMLWSATSWAICSGSAGNTILLTGTNGSITGTWAIDGSTDQTSHFNSVLANCSGITFLLDCTSNNPYYINGAVAGGRFNMVGCGRGNGGLKFGASGSWEMQPASGFGGYSTVKDMFIQGNSAATAFTMDGGSPGSDHNVFENIYCTGVKTCIKDHGAYNVVDHMWANSFLDYILWSDGVGPIWHDIALQGNLNGSLGTSTNACIYYAGASLVMTDFDINGCKGAMVIDAGTTSTGPACINGNWNHIENGFFDSGYAYPNDTTAAVLIKNLSSGNCQMGSTHFTNVGFESEKYGLYIETDNNYSSFISSVTCSGCQMHNNTSSGLVVTGWGVGLARFNDTNILSDGGSYNGGTPTAPAVDVECPYCSVQFVGSYIGNANWNSIGASYEGPNEGAKNTYALQIGSGVLTKVLLSGTLVDDSDSTTAGISDTTKVCWNPSGVGNVPPTCHN